MDLEKVLETIKNEYPTLKFETEKLGILSVIIVKGKKKKQEIRLYYNE